MRCAVLALLLALCGCKTTVHTEVTGHTRPLGPATTREYDKPQPQHLVETRTQREADGFQCATRLFTDDSGRARVNMLPVALQCLVYGHAVKLTLWSVTEERELKTETVSAERARQIIDEWSVQCRLGAQAPLRQAEKALMDRLVESSGDAPLVATLKAIRDKVEIVPDWR